jgi:hypothetical protein
LARIRKLRKASTIWNPKKEDLMQRNQYLSCAAAGLIVMASVGVSFAQINDGDKNAGPTGPGMKPAPVVPNQTGSAPQPDHIPGEATTVPPDKFDCQSVSGSKQGRNTTGTKTDRPIGAPNAGGC